MDADKEDLSAACTGSIRAVRDCGENNDTDDEDSSIACAASIRAGQNGWVGQSGLKKVR